MKTDGGRWIAPRDPDREHEGRGGREGDAERCGRFAVVQWVLIWCQVPEDGSWVLPLFNPPPHVYSFSLLRPSYSFTHSFQSSLPSPSCQWDKVKIFIPCFLLSPPFSVPKNLSISVWVTPHLSISAISADTAPTSLPFLSSHFLRNAKQKHCLIPKWKEKHLPIHCGSGSGPHKRKRHIKTIYHFVVATVTIDIKPESGHICFHSSTLPHRGRFFMHLCPFHYLCLSLHLMFIMRWQLTVKD